MKKKLAIIINGKEQLIEYRKSTKNQGGTLFFVETDLSELPRFLFLFHDGKAEYVTQSDEQNIVAAEIISNIKAQEGQM